RLLKVSDCIFLGRDNGQEVCINCLGSSLPHMPSSYLSFPAGIDFRATFGDENVMKYMHQLAVAGGHLLAHMWHTSLLVSDDMIGSMVNVQLPPTNKTVVVEDLPWRLLEKYNTYVPVFPIQGLWYTRVSAQIYNELSDFEYLGAAVLDL